MEPERAQKLGRRKINIAKSDLLKKIALFIILLFAVASCKKEESAAVVETPKPKPIVEQFDSNSMTTMSCTTPFAAAIPLAAF
jgi:hypothetical protein